MTIKNKSISIFYEILLLFFFFYWEFENMKYVNFYFLFFIFYFLFFIFYFLFFIFYFLFFITLTHLPTNIRTYIYDQSLSQSLRLSLGKGL